MARQESAGLNGKNDTFFRKEGYLCSRGLFDPVADIASLRDHMEDVFRTYIGERGALSEERIIRLYREDFRGFLGCANQCQQLPALYRLNTDERILALLRSVGLESPTLNTKPLVSFSCRALAKNDSYWKVPAHQDWPSTQGSLNGLTCWIPLCDVGEELGPLEVVPGSHLLGLVTHVERDGVPVCEQVTELQEKSFLPVPMQRGDALLFSNFTVHRSGVNRREDKIRWSIHFRYDDFSESTFIERKYPRHHAEVRKEGLLDPSFPSRDLLRRYFRARPQSGDE